MVGYNLRKRVIQAVKQVKEKLEEELPLKRCIVCGDKLKVNNVKQLCGEGQCLKEVDDSPEFLPNEKQSPMEDKDQDDTITSDGESLGSDTESELDIIEMDKRKYGKVLEKILDVNLEGKAQKEKEQFLVKHDQKEVKLEQILEAPIPEEWKTRLVEKWLMMKNSEKWTEEYFIFQKELKAFLWHYDEIDLPKEKMDEMRRIRMDKLVTLDKILAAQLPEEMLMEMMNDYNRLLGYGFFSGEYQDLTNHILKQLKSWKPEFQETFREFSKLEEDSYEHRLFTSNLPMKAKAHIFRELKHFRTMTDQDSEYSKQKYWLEYALSLPNEIKEFPVKRSDSVEKKKEFQEMIKKKLGETCYGMENVKELLLDYVFQCISKPDSVAQIIVLCGPPGIGKTTLARSLAECLDRDFISINLGGATDPTKLIGHKKSYIGSSPGEVIKGLVKSKMKNPIIYIDEMDKISKKGQEIEGVLTHLLDPSQNHEFIDDYLEIPVDISKVLFIISINDKTAIGKILADRLFIIDVDGYKKNDKVIMTKQYLLPKIYTNIGVSNISFEETAISHLIDRIMVEEGVRTLNKSLQFIVNRLNRKSQLGEKHIVVTSGIVDEILKSMPKKETELSMFI